MQRHLEQSDGVLRDIATVNGDRQAAQWNRRIDNRMCPLIEGAWATKPDVGPWPSRSDRIIAKQRPIKLPVIQLEPFLVHRVRGLDRLDDVRLSGGECRGVCVAVVRP